MMQTIKDFLASLQGDWLGEESIATTPWGAGGIALAKITNRPVFNGALLQDYNSTRDGKPWLSAHAVFIPQAENTAQLFWFDSFGFTPTEPASGNLTNEGKLEIIRRSPRGITRHTYCLLRPDSYSLSLESSFDNGSTWITVMNGRYQLKGIDPSTIPNQ